MVRVTLRKFAQIYVLCLPSLLLVACGGGGSDGGSAIGSGGEWLIPAENVRDGGPGRDGIPAINEPRFETLAATTALLPGDRVIVVRDGDTVKAYPEDILDYHEIVNDGPSDDPFILSYCPLTASAVAWKGNPTDGNSTFGVSGLLFNSNLILFDRATDSLWSQMLQVSVNGPRIRQQRENIPVVETIFATLSDMYPDAMVMTRNTGHVRQYDQYPYGSYRGSSSLLFPTDPFDNRLHPKTRAIGIHSDTAAKIYQLDGFGSETQTINDQFDGQPIVVVGNSTRSLAAIFSRELSDGTVLSMSPLQDDLPHVMQDTEGNIWDIFGEAVAGPRTGEQLETVRSYVAMYFAWSSFFDTVEIHFN